MRRRAPGEHVEPFRRRVYETEGHALRDRLAVWARSVEDAAASAWPTMPEGIVDRDSDLWEPLLTVADLAGGDWPDRARVTAVTLVTDSRESTPSLGVRLLADLWAVFQDPAKQGQNALFTSSILKMLEDREDTPWGELVGGKPVTARWLARRLKPYGVTPKTVRIDSDTAKGYFAADLADAWERYVPSSRQKSVTSVTSVTNDDSPSGEDVTDGVTDSAGVTDEFVTDDAPLICATDGCPNVVTMPGLACDDCIDGPSIPWSAR
jgi:hypothetical protein